MKVGHVRECVHCCGDASAMQDAFGRATLWICRLHGVLRILEQVLGEVVLAVERMAKINSEEARKLKERVCGGVRARWAARQALRHCASDEDSVVPQVLPSLNTYASAAGYHGELFRKADSGDWSLQGLDGDNARAIMHLVLDVGFTLSLVDERLAAFDMVLQVSPPARAAAFAAACDVRPARASSLASTVQSPAQTACLLCAVLQDWDSVSPSQREAVWPLWESAIVLAERARCRACRLRVAVSRVHGTVLAHQLAGVARARADEDFFRECGALYLMHLSRAHVDKFFGPVSAAPMEASHNTHVRAASAGRSRGDARRARLAFHDCLSAGHCRRGDRVARLKAAAARPRWRSCCASTCVRSSCTGRASRCRRRRWSRRRRRRRCRWKVTLRRLRARSTPLRPLGAVSMRSAERCAGTTACDPARWRTGPWCSARALALP